MHFARVWFIEITSKYMRASYVSLYPLLLSRSLPDPEGRGVFRLIYAQPISPRVNQYRLHLGIHIEFHHYMRQRGQDSVLGKESAYTYATSSYK